MKNGIITASHTFDILVTEEMLATLDGIVIHPVYSTFWLCYHVELCARKTIEPFFEDDENACGGGIDIIHKAMAPLGATVTISTRVSKLSDKTIICEFVAYHGETLLANGTQTQHYFPQSKIDTLISNAYKR